MNTDAIAKALEVMHAHAAGLNARDPEAIAATLHFPHFRLSGKTVKIWKTSDSYFADFKARAGDNWGSTQWSRLEPMQASETKVHLNVRVDRFDKEGKPLVQFDSLWVVTNINGVWAAQMRSSFALDPN